MLIYVNLGIGQIGVLAVCGSLELWSGGVGLRRLCWSLCRYRVLVVVAEFGSSFESVVVNGHSGDLWVLVFSGLPEGRTFLDWCLFMIGLFVGWVEDVRVYLIVWLSSFEVIMGNGVEYDRHHVDQF